MSTRVRIGQGVWNDHTPWSIYVESRPEYIARWTLKVETADLGAGIGLQWGPSLQEWSLHLGVTYADDYVILYGLAAGNISAAQVMNAEGSAVCTASLIDISLSGTDRARLLSLADLLTSTRVLFCRVSADMEPRSLRMTDHRGNVVPDYYIARGM